MPIEILMPTLSATVAKGNLTKIYKSIILGILFFPTLIVPVSAAYAGDIAQSSVMVMGEAKLKIAPDQAVVPITIVTENDSLAKAKEINDQKLKKVVKIAKNYDVKEEDIKSIYNSIQPEYGSGEQTSVEVDVYSGGVDFTFNVTELSRDKTSAFVAEAQKAGFENIVTKRSGLGTSISASFRVSNENAEIVKKKLKEKENEVINLATEKGLAKDKINSYESLQTGKQRHASQPSRHITKYKSTVVVNVTIPAKDKVMDFINDIVAEGIDNIGSVTFNLSNEKAYKDEALVTALKDAMEKAHKLADTAGMAVDHVTTISENGIQIIPVQSYYPGRLSYANMAAEKSAPVSPMSQDALPSGLIEIQQTINATFLLKQK